MIMNHCDGNVTLHTGYVCTQSKSAMRTCHPQPTRFLTWQSYDASRSQLPITHHCFLLPASCPPIPVHPALPPPRPHLVPQTQAPPPPPPPPTLSHPRPSQPRTMQTPLAPPCGLRHHSPQATFVLRPADAHKQQSIQACAKPLLAHPEQPQPRADRHAQQADSKAKANAEDHEKRQDKPSNTPRGAPDKDAQAARCQAANDDSGRGDDARGEHAERQATKSSKRRRLADDEGGGGIDKAHPTQDGGEDPGATSNPTALRTCLSQLRPATASSELFTHHCASCQRASPRLWNQWSCATCSVSLAGRASVDATQMFAPPRMPIAYVGFRADLGGALFPLVKREEEIQGVVYRRWCTWEDGVTSSVFGLSLKYHQQQQQHAGKRQDEIVQLIHVLADTEGDETALRLAKLALEDEGPYHRPSKWRMFAQSFASPSDSGCSVSGVASEVPLADWLCNGQVRTDGPPYMREVRAYVERMVEWRHTSISACDSVGDERAEHEPAAEKAWSTGTIVIAQEHKVVLSRRALGEGAGEHVVVCLGATTNVALSTLTAARSETCSARAKTQVEAEEGGDEVSNEPRTVQADKGGRTALCLTMARGDCVLLAPRLWEEYRVALYSKGVGVWVVLRR
ncbi:hypothetical protein ACQY0O_005365 [Thecaphora frezii]